MIMTTAQWVMMGGLGVAALLITVVREIVFEHQMRHGCR